jgi:hypothetical protein
MTDKYEALARFFLEHYEHYRWEELPHEYVTTIEPTDQNALLPRAMADHEAAIKLWADAIRKSGILEGA